jgi:hypothetical protein
VTAPQVAQNRCPAAPIAVPQLEQKPNPVAIAVTLPTVQNWPEDEVRLDKLPDRCAPDHRTS